MVKIIMSPKPNHRIHVQCFLGDDYGAVPVPAAIEKDEFEQMRNELVDSGEGQLFAFNASN